MSIKLTIMATGTLCLYHRYQNISHSVLYITGTTAYHTLYLISQVPQRITLCILYHRYHNTQQIILCIVYHRHKSKLTCVLISQVTQHITLCIVFHRYLNIYHFVLYIASTTTYHTFFGISQLP